MKAMLLHNTTKGKLTLRGVGIGAMPITIEKGGSYLFRSPDEFSLYSHQVQRLVAGKVAVVEEIKAQAEKPVEYERPTLVDYDVAPTREVIEVREFKEEVVEEVVEASEVIEEEVTKPVKKIVKSDLDKDELKVTLKQYQELYKASSDKEEKQKLKDAILEVKALIKKA
jgi:hypothetical protein